MLRVGSAVGGDLLRESAHNCLQDRHDLHTCLVQAVSEIMTLLRMQPLDALVLDDQFDQATWIGTLVSALKQAAPHTAILVIGSFANGAFIYELLDVGIDGYLFRGDDLA